ncbi:MAG: hypothetical protein RLZZ414_553 [Bacteroidota bacterium]|mgnify:CR=1 FL=1|jgi:hypothetical protein
MRKLFILILSLYFSINLNAQTNLNGIWKDVNSKNFKNCYLIIAQDKDSVFVNHYLEYKGTPMVEYGKGILKNDSLIYNVKVSLAVPGWSTAGQHRLKIIHDKEISGMYFDNKGNSGEIKFTKYLPKK